MKTENKQKTNLPDYGILAKSRQQRPAKTAKLHAHNNLAMMFIVSGQGKCTINADQYKLQTNSVLMINKFTSHQFRD